MKPAASRPWMPGYRIVGEGQGSSKATPGIVEGDARDVVDGGDIAVFAAAMDAKYASDYGVDFYAANLTFAIAPKRVFGIDGNDFTGSPTRWTFPDT